MLLTRRFFLQAASSTLIIPALSCARPEEPPEESPIEDRFPFLADLEFVGDGPLTAQEYLKAPVGETHLTVNGRLMPSVEGLQLYVHQDFQDFRTISTPYQTLVPMTLSHSLDFKGLCDPKIFSLCEIGDPVSVGIIPEGGTNLYTGNFLLTRLSLTGKDFA